MWLKDAYGVPVYEASYAKKRIHSEQFSEIDYSGIAEVVGYESLSTRMMISAIDHVIYGEDNQHIYLDKDLCEEKKRMYSGNPSKIDHLRYHSAVIYTICQRIHREINGKISYALEIINTLLKGGDHTREYTIAVVAVLLASKAYGTGSYLFTPIETPSTTECLKFWYRAMNIVDNGYPVKIEVCFNNRTSTWVQFYITLKKHYPEYMISGWGVEKLIDHLSEKRDSVDSSRVIDKKRASELFGLSVDM